MGRFLFVQDNAVNENLGVMSIAGLLRAAGHQAELLLLDEHRRDWQERVKAYRPHVVGLSVMTGNRKWAYKTGREVRQGLGIPVVIGGIHPTLFPEDVDFEAVDYACVGEGEYPALELLEAVEQGRDPSRIPNLLAKRNGTVVGNPPRPLLADLDALPVPARDIYYRYRFIRDLPVKRFITGRGCPFRCAFCHNPVEARLFAGLGRHVRQKSADRVLLEIEETRREAPLGRVHFSDDLFGLDRNWLAEFLPRYREEVGLPFSANLRIDMLDEPLVRALAAAGCWGLSIGLESGNAAIRNGLLKKDLDERTIVDNARLMKRHGIRLLTTNVIAAPGETLDEAFETVTLNQRIRPDYTRAAVLITYPKTEAADIAIQRCLLPPGFDIRTFDETNRRVQIETPYRREFENLCAVFNLVVRFPWLTPLARRAVHWNAPPMFAMLRRWEGIENALYHGVLNLAGLRYGVHILRNVVRDFWA